MDVTRDLNGVDPINWDLSAGSQMYSTDIREHNIFSELYPDGFIVFSILVSELDSYLPESHGQSLEQLLEKGSKCKIVELIERAKCNEKISPPLIVPAQYKTESIKLAVVGGTHRYSLAKALGAIVVPIHIEEESKEEISQFIELLPSSEYQKF